MPANTVVTLRKGSSSQWTSTNPILASGEPGYDITNNILKIGDGISTWNNLLSIFQSSSHVHGNITNSGTIGSTSGLLVTTTSDGLITTSSTISSAYINNFNSSVSGLLPIKNIIAGTNISITNNSGTYTINSINNVPDPYDMGSYPLITIISQPSNITVNASQNGTFSVTATASSPSATVAYQWQLSTNNGSSWSNISGATSNSYIRENVQASNNGEQYRCVLSANLSIINSSAATLACSTFSPTAVLLTSGTSYTVPVGATNMKVWAIGGGAYHAGGVAYKTWTVSSGSTITYSIGSASTTDWGNDSSTTFSGVTITGRGGGRRANGTNVSFGNIGGEFTGGDGGANGGLGEYQGSGDDCFGSIGNNGTIGTKVTIGGVPRLLAADVSGLFAALSLAGVNTTLSNTNKNAFGTGGFLGKYDNQTAANPNIGGYGGGGGYRFNASFPNANQRVSGAIVLYFT